MSREERAAWVEIILLAYGCAFIAFMCGLVVFR